MTANFIAHCIKYLINLLILPPHTSHLLQLLDVGVFAPFKRILAKKTDALLRLNLNRISRINWITMFIAAKREALVSKNIIIRWKGADLKPFQPQTVLRKLPSHRASTASPPFTPRHSNALNLSLLDSSPPNGTKLRKTN